MFKILTFYAYTFEITALGEVRDDIIAFSDGLQSATKHMLMLSMKGIDLCIRPHCSGL